MERSMWGLSLRDRAPNTTFAVTDTVESKTTLKWNRAGHVARVTRWTLEERKDFGVEATILSYN